MAFKALAFALFLGSVSAHAADVVQVDVVQAVPQGSFSVGAGSEVRLTLSGEAEARSGLFLGRLHQPDGTVHSYMFYDASSNSIDYVPAASVAIAANGFQDVLKLYDQEGGTCAAYALDDYLQQLHLTGFTGNGALAQTLSNEQGRTQLLVDAVNEYYLEPQHHSSTLGILNGFGKRFGFACKAKHFGDVAPVRELLETQLSAGSPVLMSFNVGPDMYTSPLKLIDFAQPGQPLDSRLWLPRARGARNSGGHAEVVTATFVVGGALQLLMLDSDWDEPRIWDFDTVFNSKTALDEVEFDTCE